ncbi:helix-turn-helix domain-containing protein [Limnoglobus roseus]|uniref:Helix-turn-helix domain-containing protein n=1 Tax=Limnoglobus roseus TaxID=2598579 RepID=A0A5C1AI76_9BACT|nr:helix-turn-helix domain-containing protein [Limnoglobus roseus]QEL19129.1 hypothetical protein PX52LOC_06187 [Limnoglobus roseus]
MISTLCPKPGSAWAKHCPTAYPWEWMKEGEALPDGFLRMATDREADLIVGRITEGEFIGEPLPTSLSPAQPKQGAARRKDRKLLHPVVRKNLGYRQFIKSATPCHPLAVAIWCWLWTCERKGLCRTSTRRLAKRFKVSTNTVTARLKELRTAGYLRRKRRGEMGKSASVYRIFPTPRLDTKRLNH